MKYILLLCLFTFCCRAQQTETVTTVRSETTVPGSPVNSATTVVTRTVVTLPVVTPTPVATASVAASVGTLSMLRTAKYHRLLWTNKTKRDLVNPAFVSATNTLSAVSISNTSDTIFKAKLKPNDTLVIPSGDKDHILMLVNSGTRRVLIKVKPKGLLTISLKPAKDSIIIKNEGNTRAFFRIRQGAILTIIKKFSKPKPVKPSGSTNLVLSNKDDTLLMLKNLPGAKLTYSNAEGTQLKIDSAGLSLNKLEGLTLSIGPKPKKPEAFADFNAKIFNDAKGFDSNQPNGLVQTDLSINLNIMKKPHIRLGNDWSIYFGKNVMLPCVNLFRTKSDSSFRYAPVHYSTRTGAIIDSTVNIHTMNLVRYASWSISTKLNVVTVQRNDKSFSFYLDAYGVFYGTGLVYDSLTTAYFSLKKEDSKFTVYSVGGGVSMKLRLGSPKSNFSVEASLVSYGLKLLSTQVHQNYGRFYEPDYNPRNDQIQNLNLNPVPVSYFRGITVYGIQVRYSSKANKDNGAGSGIFFRLNYSTNPFLADSKVNYGNNFIQIQTGLSVNIKDLLTSAGLAEPK